MHLRPLFRSRRPRSRKGLITATTIGLVAAPLALVAGVAPAQAEPDDSDLVISEVYGGGGQTSRHPALQGRLRRDLQPDRRPGRPAGLPRDLPVGVGQRRRRRVRCAARLADGDTYLVQMSSVTGGATPTLATCRRRPDRVATPAVSMASRRRPGPADRPGGPVPGRRPDRRRRGSSTRSGQATAPTPPTPTRALTVRAAQHAPASAAPLTAPTPTTTAPTSRVGYARRPESLRLHGRAGCVRPVWSRSPRSRATAPPRRTSTARSPCAAS